MSAGEPLSLCVYVAQTKKIRHLKYKGSAVKALAKPADRKKKTSHPALAFSPPPPQQTYSSYFSASFSPVSFLLVVFTFFALVAFSIVMVVTRDIAKKKVESTKQRSISVLSSQNKRKKSCVLLFLFTMWRRGWTTALLKTLTRGERTALNVNKKKVSIRRRCGKNAYTDAAPRSHADFDE